MVELIENSNKIINDGDFIIETNEKLGFKTITCKEGHYITNWNKVDILEYNAATIICCPIYTKVEQYYCIDAVEHNRLMEEKSKAEEELIKNHR